MTRVQGKHWRNVKLSLPSSCPTSSEAFLHGFIHKHILSTITQFWWSWTAEGSPQELGGARDDLQSQTHLQPITHTHSGKKRDIKTDKLYLQLYLCSRNYIIFCTFLLFPIKYFRYIYMIFIWWLNIKCWHPTVSLVYKLSVFNSFPPLF